MTAFVRARRPEHKQQRREAILAAARDLAVERGVRDVTLGALADRVGLAKSNVVRYFGTREDIFVELCTQESLALRDALLDRLPGVPPPDVAHVFTRVVLEHELFAELVSQLTTNLEHNVSFEAAQDLKVTTSQVRSELTVALVAAVPGLTEEAGQQFLGAATLLVSGAWAASRPSEMVQRVYAAHPELVGGHLTLQEQVEPVLAALLRGLTAG